MLPAAPPQAPTPLHSKQLISATHLCHHGNTMLVIAGHLVRIGVLLVARLSAQPQAPCTTDAWLVFPTVSSNKKPCQTNNIRWFSFGLRQVCIYSFLSRMGRTHCLTAYTTVAFHTLPLPSRTSSDMKQKGGDDRRTIAANRFFDNCFPPFRPLNMLRCNVVNAVVRDGCCRAHSN